MLRVHVFGCLLIEMLRKQFIWFVQSGKIDLDLIDLTKLEQVNMF